MKSKFANLAAVLFAGAFAAPGVTWDSESCTGVVAAGNRVVAAETADDLRTIRECRPRAGLPNVLKKLRAGGPVRLAYLGGSITEARRGWREKTTDWFRREFPKAAIEEVNAAISGTGSDYGAIRLAADVLAQKPDLLFVEFRVNGSAGFDVPTVEGIVRQARRANPELDICFVYTVADWMLEGLKAGRQTSFGCAMERVCERYGVPSIDFAPAIVAQLDDPSAFVFAPARGGAAVEAVPKDVRAATQAGGAVPDKLVFSMDGTHPTEAGHALYRDILARALTGGIFPVASRPGPHPLPEPLATNAWERCETVPAREILTAPAWRPIADGRQDPVYGDSYNRTERMLKGGFETTTEGAAFTVSWDGTVLGFSDIPQAKEGEKPIVIEVSVDGGKPVVFERRRTREKRIYSRFVYLPEQPQGRHTAVFTVKRIPAGQRCILGQFLVIGRRL